MTPPARDERRWATVVFADLSDFSSIPERLDPEDVKALAQRSTERLAQEIHRFGGTVIDVMGDRLQAAFGAPIAHEDDAERGVRAGLAMRNSPLPDSTGVRMQVRVGVSTGEVIAGPDRTSRASPVRCSG